MDWLAEANALTASGQPFALATVVRRIAPASAQPGAKAIVLPDGTMRGWVGGSCAQSVVVTEALQALRAGQQRLLRLGHMPGARESDDAITYPMTCHSGGALEIMIEPVLPAARLVLVGATPVSDALAALAGTMGYRIDRHADSRAFAEHPGVINAASSIVVATMGVDDEETLAAALRSSAPYIALVASPKRAGVVRETLTLMGVSPEDLAKLKAPAGLDIGARSQEEIALSILAEIVQMRGEMPERLIGEPAAAGAPAEALDPVCGMSVTIAGAHHTAEFGGMTWYFCCGGCKSRFLRDPALFAAA
ncbi:MAG: XdhC family protein [Thermomicrobiales bacterium]